MALWLATSAFSSPRFVEPSFSCARLAVIDDAIVPVPLFVTYGLQVIPYSRIPQNEIDALVGTSPPPSDANRYVTNTDPRLSGGSSLVKIAGAALSGHRVVRASSATDVLYCDANTPGDSGRALGMTLGAAAMGAPVSLATDGSEVAEPTWTWTPGQRIYIGAAGALVSNPAGLSWSQVVAVAESATKVYVRFREPILLV